MGREAKKYLTMNGKSNMSDEQFADMVDARRKYHSARHHKNPSKKDDEPVSRAIERHEKLSELDTSTTSMESASSDLAATTAQLAGESPPSHKSSKTSASTLARMTGNLSPRRYNQGVLWPWLCWFGCWISPTLGCRISPARLSDHV
eukprot:m.81960 g.81960  ORF g.81960 m.81960 type:complete len:147 (+) comp14709_c0_seq3:406-846(+)